jgi:23S rRNA (guanosine2251-2'-O)-methyltransferase
MKRSREVHGEPRRSDRSRRGAPEGEGRRYVYGVNPVLEALRAHPEQIERLYVSQGNLATSHAAEIFSRSKDAGVRVDKVPRERLAILADGGVHQGVVAEVREYTYAEISDIL